MERGTSGQDSSIKQKVTKLGGEKECNRNHWQRYAWAEERHKVDIPRGRGASGVVAANFIITCGQISNGSNLREEGLVFAHGFRGFSS